MKSLFDKTKAGAIVLEDYLYICKELAKRGIDATEISGNFPDFRGNTAYFKDIADKVANETSVPIIVTGGNHSTSSDFPTRFNQSVFSKTCGKKPLFKLQQMP